MRQRGVVIEKENSRLRVKIQDPNEVCGSCNGCIRLTPGRPQEDLILSFEQAAADYEVGDAVIVETADNKMVRALAVLYGVPFTTLFIGYALTRLITGEDMLGGIGAIIGLLVGALGARIITRRVLNSAPKFRIVARACS